MSKFFILSHALQRFNKPKLLTKSNRHKVGTGVIPGQIKYEDLFNKATK